MGNLWESHGNPVGILRPNRGHSKGNRSESEGQPMGLQRATGRTPGRTTGTPTTGVLKSKPNTTEQQRMKEKLGGLVNEGFSADIEDEEAERDNVDAVSVDWIG